MRRCRSQRGFSLFELALVLALTGLLVAGSIVVARTFGEKRRRAETRTYLAEAKAAVLAHAGDYGKLPGLDISAAIDVFGDGHADTFAPNVHGWLPHLDLRLKGRDPFASQLKYCARGALLDRNTSCGELKAFLNGTEPAATWYPKVWHEGMDAATAFNGMPVAAVILSPGRPLFPPAAFEKRLSDVNNTPLDLTDDVLVGNDAAACGDAQNYLDAPQSEGGFDDMLVYVTVSELYDALGCAK